VSGLYELTREELIGLVIQLHETVQAQQREILELKAVVASQAKRIEELERENRILKQKLARAEDNRLMLEEALETHSNALKVRNAELEESRELIQQSEARYLELAHHDSLTGLPNRVFFYEYLERAFAHAKFSRKRIALLYLDLDNFKPVNDSFGHDAGDAVLRQTAERLMVCVRSRDMVMRIGGDEFAILLPDQSGLAPVKRVAQRVVNMLSKPYDVKGTLYEVGVSIGISIYPDDDEDPEKLLQKADLAMYNAKKGTQSEYWFFRDIV
jgi:diguanylate cyclase (GGDEF)-like protein